MNHTEHYNLSQFEKSDRIQMEDFNADNAAIDAALKANADAIGTKANSATVGALTTRVGNLESGKVDTTVFAALQNTVSALAANLGSTGKNVRIATGSYTGNGKSGAQNPNSLSFTMNPLLVFIASGSASEAGLLAAPVTGSLFYNGYTRSLVVTWSGKTVSWYTSTTSNAHLAQLNSGGATYYWLALGYDDE